jgi:formylglycine-generating enzyme required for sulfatase activity
MTPLPLSPHLRGRRIPLTLVALLISALSVFAADGEKRPIPGLNLTLVPIPAGTFTMGHPVGQYENDSDEGPETRVTLTKPFWLGATELTIAQWRLFIDATGYLTEAEKDGGLWVWIGPGSVWEKRTGTNWRNPGGGLKQAENHPVVGVSWNDAQRFCAWLTERERSAGRLPAGYVYGLPTEAQWEYAARAGAPGLDNHDDDDSIWYAKNSGLQTQPVGTKKANAWGLYDMRGSVWEWCQDWYGPYPGGSVTDPQGPATGTIRENRGGGWNSVPGHGISAFNRWDTKDVTRRNNLGLRVALIPAR